MSTIEAFFLGMMVVWTPFTHIFGLARSACTVFSRSRAVGLPGTRAKPSRAIHATVASIATPTMMIARQAALRLRTNVHKSTDAERQEQ